LANRRKCLGLVCRGGSATLRHRIGFQSKCEVSGMKRAVRLGSLLVLLLACGVRADLHADIENILQDKLLQRSSVGVEVVRLGKTDSQTQLVYEHDARKPLTPASN